MPQSNGKDLNISDGYPIYKIDKIFNDNDSTDESSLPLHLKAFSKNKHSSGGRTLLRKRDLTQRLEDFEVVVMRDPKQTWEQRLKQAYLNTPIDVKYTWL